METQKTSFQFQSKTYEVIVDKGAVSVSEHNKAMPFMTFSSRANTLQSGIEKAKKKIERLMLQRPDPGMTFSD